MEDYRFTTVYPLFNNERTMSYFLDELFNEVFTISAKVTYDDGTYVEVDDGEGNIWGLHASGNGDFISHRIRFELLNK